MTTLYFVRHGQTEWNIERRFQGANGDSPLLPKSYADMRAVGHFLQDKQIVRIYASSLKRARITAANIQTCLPAAPKLSLHSNLKEVALGSWEGQPMTAVQAADPENYAHYRVKDADFNPANFGGETYEAVADRVRRLVSRVCQEYPDQAVLFVAHGLVLNFALTALLGYSRQEAQKLGGLANTSTTSLTSADGQHFQLLAWNDTSYLTGEQTTV
ncbi:histidine phosphatase family protein [Leuconostocaceae bacterium ESL0958]|nr:histidine phosphatase family protein [Leuconostocaceae bacterium ESL0958]